MAKTIPKPCYKRRARSGIKGGIKGFYLRKKVYFFLFFLFLIVIAGSYFETQKTIEKFSNIKAKTTYNTRIKEYKFILHQKIIFLNAFAKFLASAKPVIDGYLHNNRQEIINFVMPLYKSLYPNLIQEIHFFKTPAISFVNFSNTKIYGQNLSKVRADIVWIDTSFKPSDHFYICRIYPGLRATYPIFYKHKLLGSLSFGINIIQFKKMFMKLGVQNVSIYLKDSLLHKYLKNDAYSLYSKWPLYKGYRVNGKIFHIPLEKEGYILKNGYVYTEIPIIDFFKNKIGYIIIKDNINPAIQIIKQESQRKLIFLILSYVVVLVIIFILFEWIFRKMDEIKNIITHLKNHEFDKIPTKIKVSDELDIYKEYLVEVANEIKSYINKLNNKVKRYSNKAYIDAMTGAYNRRFLEEKDKEIIQEHKFAKTDFGIIMLDIDNFKQINDTYGHEIGDKVIKLLAKEIKKIIRKDDFLIRYGGEEFVIILKNANASTAHKVAEKIRKTIENIKIDSNGKEVHFTVSLGISEITEKDNSIFDAIKRADEKLYIAKKTGKNRVEV
jgi:diguanylate cyclase (GGDEF)-like protein